MPFQETAQVDLRLLPAAILILFALWVLAGLALACATRLEMIPTLAVCSGIFLLGLMSDYLFGRLAQPVWMADLRAEVEHPRRTEEQKALLKEIAEQYDRDRTGWLNVAGDRRLTVVYQSALNAAFSYAPTNCFFGLFHP